jgi:hypothetical protein
VTFQNLSQRLSGSLGSFLFNIILQRLRNVAVIKSQTYSQYTLVFNKNKKLVFFLKTQQLTKYQQIKNPNFS